MRWTVVGNPGNRRVTLFSAAAIRAGLPQPEIVAWKDVVTGMPVRFGAGHVIRVDSPGEDPLVNQALRQAHRPADHGEIIGGRAWYTGFSRALIRIRQAADECHARLLTDPAETMVIFDKAACHRRLATAGIPVPSALTGSPSDWGELRTWLADAGWRRVFIKPLHGSSASGVIAMRLSGDGRIAATTSVELAEGRLFNSLRVRHYRRERDIAMIINALAPDGLHIEQWFPKAGVDGRVVDMRVVVIAGSPSHIVVRASRSPMTNLHLGGVRGDLEAVRAAAGSHYEAGLETCRAVAACFPGSHQVAVDLMFRVGWQSHAVAEVNAFGDLLPGLLVEGQDTYDAQIAALRKMKI